MTINQLAQNVGIGEVDPPTVLPNELTSPQSAFGSLVELGINILVILAGIYVLFNIIFAGYGFMSAGNDPKKVEEARDKITQSFIGISVIVGSTIILMLISRIITGEYTTFLRPIIPTI